MSEEANLAHLQEKMKATKRKKHGGNVMIGSGMYSIALDLTLNLLRPDLVYIPYRVFLVILEAILVVRRTIIHENARRHYHDLVEQFKETRQREEEHCKPEQPETIGSLTLAQIIRSFQTRIKKLRSEKSDLKVKIEKFRKIAADQIRLKEEENRAFEEEMTKLKKELESLKESIGSLE